MDTLTQDLTLFENDDWRVTGAGLEHQANGYFIERDQLAAKHPDGLWVWPLHLLEKAWCEPQTFSEAFMEAVRWYRIEPDGDLARSFLISGLESAERAIAARKFEITTARHADPISLGELVTVEVEVIRHAAGMDMSPALGLSPIASRAKAAR